MGAAATAVIRELNDAFRQSFVGGKVVLTASVAALQENDQASVLELVRSFREFDTGNDPHGEHDFGAVTHADVTYFWKIDYYGPNLDTGSENPADPAVTTRVLTIMRADEY